MTVETTRQARSFAPFASSPDTIGISADDSAPAATSWKIRSGIRNAAKNASRSDATPTELTMTTCGPSRAPARRGRRRTTIRPARARARRRVTRRGSRRARGCASR